MLDYMQGVTSGLTFFLRAFNAQQEVLRDFHGRAARVLGPECPLRDYAPTDLSMERNIFSSLFLAAELAAGLPAERLHFYGLVNQCMRAWVTGCDNLLDDEYKQVLPFDLPEGGYRARSVLIIMAADRVLTDLLCEELAAGRLSPEQCAVLSHHTLRALVPSALQEDEEESGVGVILTPDEILRLVHVPKTGLLFEAPLIPPEKTGEVSLERSSLARSGLRAFGVACQILDDVVDLDDDIRMSHHSFVVSLAAHGAGDAGKTVLRREEISIGGLDLARARREACDWSARQFAESREKLAAVGLQAGDAEWEGLVLTIAKLLRVPEDLVARIKGTS